MRTNPASYGTPLQTYADQLRRLAQRTSTSERAPSLGATSTFTASERDAVFAATGGVIGDDGVVDFTVGPAAGRNSGKIPEGMTSMQIVMGGLGSVTWYGAAGSSALADGPGQNADLPQSTLTGMRITPEPGATTEQREELLAMAVGYVHALNTGANLSWAPHAIFDVKVGG